MIIKAKSYFATPFLQMSFSGILSLSHPRASIARPGDLLDCRVKPGNDGGKKKCTGMAEERKTSTEMATKRKRQKPLKRN